MNLYNRQKSVVGRVAIASSIVSFYAFHDAFKSLLAEHAKYGRLVKIQGDGFYFHAIATGKAKQANLIKRCGLTVV